jgi:phospholipase/lecithinase/hemolysin
VPRDDDHPYSPLRPAAGLVVIGDSLSDGGNAGRFSDGPVWVERLAVRLGLPLRPSRLGGTNHATGGARASLGPASLRAQADAVLAAARGGALDPAALHVVWGGGNDLLAAAMAPDPLRAVEAAAAAVGGVVDDLAAAGAGLLLVPNLPDVGLTPALRAFGPAIAAAARRLTRAYDAALEAALAGVEARRRPGAPILRLDVWAMAERTLADPAASGFRDVATPCQGQGSCEGFLFWDHVHPTAAAHARLAEAALETLAGRARR